MFINKNYVTQHYEAIWQSGFQAKSGQNVRSKLY